MDGTEDLDGESLSHFSLQSMEPPADLKSSMSYHCDVRSSQSDKFEEEVDVETESSGEVDNYGENFPPRPAGVGVVDDFGDFFPTPTEHASQHELGLESHGGDEVSATSPSSAEDHEDYVLKFIAGFLYAFLSCGILPFLTCCRWCRSPEKPWCPGERKWGRVTSLVGMCAGLVAIPAIVLGILAARGYFEEEAIEPAIQTTVDLHACQYARTICPSSTEPSSPENRNPIRLLSLVTDEEGYPVRGLAFDEWEIGARIAPLEAAGFGICRKQNCRELYNESGISSGLYTLFLELLSDGNWVPGSYAGTLQIDDVGSSRFDFEIPRLFIEAVASVDTAFCMTEECLGIGHTNASASTANHNPVLLQVFVTKRGLPLSGLKTGNFSINSDNDAFSICNPTVCGRDNIESAAGFYEFLLDRKQDGNWLAAIYTGTCIITVSDGSNSVHFGFKIFAPDQSPFLSVEVIKVDTKACTLDIPQCSSDVGHDPGEEVSTDNHNPIRLVVQISNGVTMQRIPNLNISNFYVESEGNSFGVCNNTDCGYESFNSSSFEGVYVLSLTGCWRGTGPPEPILELSLPMMEI